MTEAIRGGLTRLADSRTARLVIVLLLLAAAVAAVALQAGDFALAVQVTPDGPDYDPADVEEGTSNLFGIPDFKSVVESFFNGAGTHVNLMDKNDSPLLKGFDEMLGMGTATNHSLGEIVRTIYSAAVMPAGTVILAIVFLLKLVEIAGRMDGSASVPAVKEVIFTLVFYVIFLWLLQHSFEIMQCIYHVTYSMIWHAQEALTDLGITNEAGNTNFKLKDGLGVGELLMLLLLGIITWLISIAGSVIVTLMCWARALQIYVMAALSPIPIAMMGYEQTRSAGVGYIKNFAAVCLAGLILLIIGAVYPYLTVAVIGTGVIQVDLISGVIKVIAINLLLIMACVKSGAWAKEAVAGA